MPDSHAEVLDEPPSKKQKTHNSDATLEQKLPQDKPQPSRGTRRTAPSQIRRNLERVKRFKEKNGISDGGSNQSKTVSSQNVSLPSKPKDASNQQHSSYQNGTSMDSREDLRKTAASLLQVRKSLPIATHEKAIREALRKHDVLVLVGETGSGKSTQLPQYLQSEPWCRQTTLAEPSSTSAPEHVKKKQSTTNGGEKTEPSSNADAKPQVTRYIGGCIAITEPRRVAATTLARRVAREMGTPLGKASPNSKVGYSVRFDDNTSPRVRVKFLTDGMLLQELLRDPALSRYSAVVVDEVHERGVNVDLLLGLLKKLLMQKDSVRHGVPLKVVIMSATADAEELVRFFGTGTTVSSESDEDEGNHATRPHTKVSSPESRDLVANETVSQLEVGGRQHPVRIVHTPRPVQDILEAALVKIFELNFREPLPGDILVFMTGQGTVESLCSLIQDYNPNLSKAVPQLLALPLYAALPQEAQQRIFDPIPPPWKGQRWTRKVIVSTNLAETSVTIPGVRYVVDGGKEKVKQYRPQIGLESLLTKAVSQSAAIQRAGRAGREAAGICYRLFRADDFHALAPTLVPEILRSDLSQAYLFLLARGVSAADLSQFPLIARPPRAATEAALISLNRIGAVDDEGKVTEDGKIMASLPVSAAMARVLLTAASPSRDCLDEAIDLVAAMSGEDIFRERRRAEESGTAEEVEDRIKDDLRRSDGDHVAMIRAVRGFAEEQTDRKAWAKERGLSWRALREMMKIRKQLLGLASRLQAPYQAALAGSSGSSPEQQPAAAGSSSNLLRCLLAGYPHNVAVLDTHNRYRIVGSRQEIAVHPSSALHGRASQSVPRKSNKPAAIIYTEYVFTSKAYARAVSTIDVGILLDAASHVGKA